MAVLLLADAASRVGTGHVMRSLVLGSELASEGFQVVVAGTGVAQVGTSAPSLKNLEKITLRTPFDSSERIEIVETLKPSFVILDGYEFPFELFNFLDKAGVPYGLIDDYGRTQATKPLFILNQNPSSTTVDYKKKFPDAELFRGLEFCLIRREIREQALRKPESDESRYVFVALGGSDVGELTLPICNHLSELGVATRVVVGPLVHNRDEVAHSLASLTGCRVVDSSNYEEVLNKASLALLGAGSSLWEAAFLEVRTVAICVAENQLEAAAAAKDVGLVPHVLHSHVRGLLPVGFESSVDEAIRQAFGTRCPSNSRREEISQRPRISSKITKVVEFIKSKSR